MVAIIALSACGGSSSPAVTPTPTTVPATATVAVTGPLVVGTIAWATSIDPVTQAPVSTVTAITSSAPAIYASVPLQNVAIGTVFTATWSYNGTPLESMTTTVTAQEQRATWQLTFSLTSSNGTLWPTGTYQVVISANGATSQTATIELANG